MGTQRLTAFYGALYTYFFSLLVPCGVNVNDLFTQSSALVLLSLWEEKIAVSENSCNRAPKKKGGKKRWWKWNDAGHLR
jgi:hypothetical protein